MNCYMFNVNKYMLCLLSGVEYETILQIVSNPALHQF